MKRQLLALVPWMVLTAAAGAQTRSADVLYTHFDAYPTHALRVGDECFVALEDVTAWGWAADTWADTVSVKAEGKSFDVPFRNINGRPCLPLVAAMRKLGGNAEWLDNTDTLAVYGTVESVTVRDGKLRLETTMDFRPHTITLNDPSRLVVDMIGVRLDPKKTKLDLDGTAHISQFKPNVVRLVVDSTVDVTLDRLNGQATQNLEVLYGGVDTQVAPPPPPANPPITQSAVKTVTPPTPPPPTGALEVRVESETDNQLNLRIPTRTTGVPIIEKPDASTLRITLPGVALALDPDYRVASPSVTAITATVAANSTIVTLNLVRPMGAEVVTATDGVGIQLVKPEVGDGHLAGKLIVVDPGHGDWDPGTFVGNIREKEINLAIGKLIAEGLTHAGATVIMTRKTDVFIPLTTRSDIANRNHADLFISNHVNATIHAGTQSGSITFHHMGKPVSRVLAECIEQEIAKVSGIPNIGVWSDAKLYKSGFAVLRQTNMPGVLIEVGFLNHPRDRKRIVTDDFQRAVAAAVVRGVKVYLGDAKTN